MKTKTTDLTLREKQVLQLSAHGRTVKEIAGILFISSTTVQTHYVNIQKKLLTKNITHSVARAVSKKIIEGEY